MAEKSELELLARIIELLEPVSNMAKYQIGQINQASQEAEVLAKFKQEQIEKYQADQKKLEKL